jgi:hypothetical protein
MIFSFILVTRNEHINVDGTGSESCLISGVEPSGSAAIHYRVI